MPKKFVYIFIKKATHDVALAGIPPATSPPSQLTQAQISTFRQGEGKNSASVARTGEGSWLKQSQSKTT
jgi:hypothetical protein